MHPLVHDGPALEIELLGFLKERGGFVYVGVKVPEGALALSPYGLQAGASRRILLHYAGYHTPYSIRGDGALGAVDVVVDVIDGIGAAVVLKRKVIVPAWAGKEHPAPGVLVHICAPVGVRVAAELSHNEVLEEGINVQILPVAVNGILEIGSEKGRFHLTEVVLDEGPLGRCNLIGIRIMDSDGDSS